LSLAVVMTPLPFSFRIVATFISCSPPPAGSRLN
jgi:hypothetical protein